MTTQQKAGAVPGVAEYQRALAQVVRKDFYRGRILLEKAHIPDETIETAGTDGEEYRYNPAAVLALTEKTRRTLIAHEASHIERGHHLRRNGRDMATWNEACDQEINNDLVADGYDPIDGWLCDSQYKGQSAERIYDSLHAAKQSKPQPGQQQTPPQPGQGPGQPGGAPTPGQGSAAGVTGVILDAPNPDKAKKEHRNLLNEAIQAAKMCGNLSGNQLDVAKALKQPQLSWAELLRDECSLVARNDYSWANPNRRYAHGGIILPGLKSHEMGAMVVHVDTSGSLRPWELQHFASEVRAIVQDVKPKEIVVMYIDQEIKGVETFEDPDEFDLDCKGRGGTDFRPGFAHVESEDIQPAIYVCFTDLAVSAERYPAAEPDYPVIWVSTDSKRAAPWGRTVYITPHWAAR